MDDKRRTRIVRLRAPVPVRARGIGLDSAAILDQDLAEETTVTGVTAGGKVPAALLAAPLKVTSVLWDASMGGDGAAEGDFYQLMVDGKKVDELELTATLPPTIELAIPQAELDALAEDEEHTVQMVVETLGFDHIYYETTTFFIDRTPPGGAHLGAIDFPDDIDKSGLTLAQLNALPNKVLPGIVPNYEYQQANDTIEIHAREEGKPATDVLLLTMQAGVDSGEIVAEFDQATLEKLDPAGVYEFYFFVTDEVGNKSAQSLMTPLRLWIKGAPAALDAPIVPAEGATGDGTIYDADARPVLRVEIPPYEGAQAGHIIRLRVGATDVGDTTLTAADLANDPLLELDVGYALFAPAATPPIAWVADLDVSYRVIANGLESPSEVNPVHFNLEIPGSPDPDPDPDPNPDPDKPDNPNDALLPPSVVGASNVPNVISIADGPKAAKVIVKWKDKNGVDALKVGDELQPILKSADYGAVYTVLAADADADVEIDIPVANPGDTHKGSEFLYCNITRTLDVTVPVTVATPAATVTFVTESEIPGAGKPLSKSFFVAAAGRSRYVINGSDIIKDNGAKVRCYVDDANVAKDMELTWHFEGFLKGETTPAPGTATDGTHLITELDLERRDDETVPPNPDPVQRAYVDIVVPKAYVDPIGGGGKASFVYTITATGIGAGTSTMDEVVADIRYT